MRKPGSTLKDATAAESNEPFVDETGVDQVEEVTSSSSGWRWLVAVLVFQALYLAPALQVGYLWDDVGIFDLRDQVRLESSSIWAEATDNFLKFLRAGRFYPGNFYLGYGTFYFIDSELLYKAYLLAMTIVASTTTWFLFRRFGLNHRMASLAIIIATASMQFSDYASALLGFNALFQTLLLCVTGSLLMMFRALKSGKKRFWIASLTLFLLASLTYEATPAMLPLFVLVALRERESFRDRLLSSLPFVLVSGVFLGIAVFVRSISTEVMTGYGFSLDPSSVLTAYIYQAASAVPGSFQLHSLPDDLRTGDPSLLMNAHVALLVIFAGALTALILIREKSQERDSGLARPWLVSGVGVVLLFISFIPIIVSEKYQVELRPGWGYLPVFFQVFGFGLLCAVAVGVSLSDLQRKTARIQGAFRVAVVVAVVSATWVDAQSNVRLASRLSLYKDQRHELQSLAPQLLAGVPEGSRLYAPRFWQDQSFWYRYTNKRLDVRQPFSDVPDAEPRDLSACRSNAVATYQFVQIEDEQGVRYRVDCVGPL